MISELIRRAEQGEPLWMPDLRAAFSLDPDAARVVLRLTPIRGVPRDYALCLPHWRNPEEARFVAEYLYACVFNLLSVCSGRELRFFLDRDDRPVADLIAGLSDVFQLNRSPRRGYGKVISIADRLCAAEGFGPFSFAVSDLREYSPAADSPSSPGTVSASGAPGEAGPSLPDRLRQLARAAESRVLCGVDVGGTDIKLALSVDGALVCTAEYDWNPAASKTADEILTPIVGQVRELCQQAASQLCLSEPLRPDAVGVSFPDIVLDDRILGGETPKTDGLRRNPALDYEQEFRKLSRLKALLLNVCKPGASVRIVNDGHMAAFTAAMELSAEPGPSGLASAGTVPGADAAGSVPGVIASGSVAGTTAARGESADALRDGLIAHTLGTDLGTGWLKPDGSIPPLPLELYDLILDLGSRPSAALSPEDLRSTRNENSGLTGARRYLGQSAAFRLAQELDPSLLRQFTEERDGALQVRTRPEDLRKPCLEYLMRQADAGLPAAKEVFRRVGLHLAVLCDELERVLPTGTPFRFLYGRFIKLDSVFRLLCEGCAARSPGLRLVAADDSLARTPLMLQLAARPGVTVAQFGQAVGALYYGMA